LSKPWSSGAYRVSLRRPPRVTGRLLPEYRSTGDALSGHFGVPREHREALFQTLQIFWPACRRIDVPMVRGPERWRRFNINGVDDIRRPLPGQSACAACGITRRPPRPQVSFRLQSRGFSSVHRRWHVDGCASRFIRRRIFADALSVWRPASRKLVCTDCLLRVFGLSRTTSSCLSPPPWPFGFNDEYPCAMSRDAAIGLLYLPLKRCCIAWITDFDP